MFDLGKIIIFCVIVWSGFVGFARFGIPMIIPAAPPVEEKLTGDITMEQYTALGGKIFNGKGTCTLCHNPVGGRAPLLDTIGSLSEERIKDPSYKGEAKTGEEYIHESMVATSAFVVPGFGKKGSNDTVSPMPDVSKGAIGLSDVEIGAVIAYLQEIAGVEITVALPSGDAAADSGEEEEAAPPAPAETAEAAFEKFGCGTCHMHAKIEDGGDMGPDLGKVAETAGTRKEGMTAEQFVVESILNPDAVIADGFEGEMMPSDFAQQMTVAEMNLIVNAILGKE